jgi:hypothetical protein
MSSTVWATGSGQFGSFSRGPRTAMGPHARLRPKAQGTTFSTAGLIVGSLVRSRTRGLHGLAPHSPLIKRRGRALVGNGAVAEPTIKPVCPKMCPSGGIDELSRDPHSVGRFANAPFQHVAHPKLAPDLLHVDGAPLVRETRVAGDDYSEDDTFLFPLKARSSPRNLNQLAVTPDRYRRLSRDSASS